MRRIVVLALLAAAVGAPAGARAGACDGPPAAFVAVAYDSAQRSDFLMDLDHFRAFANTLKSAYCLPEHHVRIRGMNGGARDGYVFDEGTEAGFKADLAWAAALAAEQPGTTTFVMLSSHGLFYAGDAAAGCDAGPRAVGSRAILRAGGGEDGALYDCELGRVLNEGFPEAAPMFVAIDCSFCGGFSDSITAASGTARDDVLTGASGIPARDRVVITGCAITTECFGRDDGGVLYEHLARALAADGCDGYSAPGFPTVQGLNLPVRAGPYDGLCSSSEWFFGAVASAYEGLDPYEVQQQFRIKYGFPTRADDITILSHR